MANPALNPPVPPPNPPIPAGTELWVSAVSPDMTSWAKTILNDPSAYPMFSTTQRWFAGIPVLARVEWHSWTFRNGVQIQGVFRGVTLYKVLNAAQATVEGIDVSHYQGAISWAQVAASGNVFAFIQATQGTGYIDATFAANWAQAAAAGILRGAYHIFYPNQDPVDQAERFLSTLTSKGELPVALDLEQVNAGVGVPLDTVANGVSAWVDYVSANYGRPIVYVSPAYWNALPNKGIEPKADLWVAEYGVAAPVAVGQWGLGYTFWQYTGTGAANGITGAVDQDHYNGSLDQLHAYLTRVETNAGPPHSI